MLISLIAVCILIVIGVVEYEIEPVRELPEAGSRRRLEFPKLTILLKLFLIVEDIARHGKIIIKLDPHVSPAVFAEHNVAVRVDVLGILKPQLHHRGDRMFEAVGSDEMPGFRDLLNR